MELFQLFGKIAIDNAEAKKAINDTTTDAKSASDEQSKAFEKIGSAAKTVGKGILTVGATIGGAFIGAVEGTREYRTEMAKLDTAFVTNGHSSEAAKKTYSALNAVLGDSGQSVEAANHLAVLTDNENDLGTWTDICTGIFATFGDSLPIEGLTEAANETAKVGQVTGPLADALNWAGISEDAFNEKLEKCSNEQERQKLIMDTLNGVYSKASDQYKSTNKDVMDANVANEKLTDAMAKLGAVGEPIMTAIKMAIASMAEKAIPVLESLGNKILDLIKWFKENEEKVKLWAGVIGIATATAAGFVLVLAWSAIMSKASSALALVTSAVKKLNLAMKANLIGLIVTLILGLVAAFIYLWNNCESFRNFWINLWNVIKKAASTAWTAIKNAWNGIGAWFKEKFNTVQKSGQDAMNKVKKFFADAWTAIKKAWGSVKSFFSGIWNGIKSVFSTVGSWFANIFRSAWNGIKNVWNGAKAFFNTVKSWITTPFNAIKSTVSKVFGSIYSTIKDKINAAKDTVKTVVDKIKGFFDFKFKMPKIPIPKFSIAPSGWKIGDLLKGKKPSLSIKWNAEGGIVEDPSIVGQLSDGTFLGAGEKGAEAIIPLEHNTEWIDRVADRLKENQNIYDFSPIISRLNQIIMQLERMLGMKVYIDSNILVGELAPALDKKLGSYSIKKIRGNI